MMNIFELLSFDIVEFATSIEGILIIVGILFLIIGIVLLCMGRGKKKEDVESVLPVDSEPAPVNPVATNEMSAPLVIPTEEAKVETPIVNVQPEVPSVVTSSQEATPIVMPTTDGGLQESATSPVVEPINFTAEVKAEPIQAAVPTPTPVVNETLNAAVVPTPEVVSTPTPVVGPVMEEKVMPEVLVETPAPVVTPAPVPPVTVYGGTNPEAVITREVLEEKPREIYGGANPLENTAPIPTDTVREAYSGGLSSTHSIPVVTPAPTVSVVETPAAPVVTPAPAPMPAVDLPTPVLESAPVAPAPTVVPAAPTPVTVEPQVQSSFQPKTEEIEKLEF